MLEVKNRNILLKLKREIVLKVAIVNLPINLKREICLEVKILYLPPIPGRDIHLEFKGETILNVEAHLSFAVVKKIQNLCLQRCLSIQVESMIKIFFYF
jgi:hypothetical protein